MNTPLPNVNYIIVAHPDDETLFFASLLLTRKDEIFKIICVTDANADGQGEKRKADFELACKKLGAKNSAWLGLPDIYEKRLSEKQLHPHLKDIELELEQFKENGQKVTIFTHGPVGEYMHPHHQDVSHAVISYFENKIDVFCAAYNCSPDFSITLNEQQFKVKTDILTNIYGSETKRFVNLIPATWAEGFMRVSSKEASEVYHCLKNHTGNLEAKNLSKYLWIKDFLEKKSLEKEKRLF